MSASRQVAHGEQQREDADRHIDVEHRAPDEGVGQPAAEGGAEDRRHHDAEAENGERLAVLLLREGVEQDGLAQGHERRAANALHQAEDHHAFEVPGEAAQRRGDHEADDGEDQEAAPAEPRGEIAGERHHHGGRHEIRGEHPGDLIGGGAEGAEHVRDRHAHDGDVEHFEDRGEHDGDDEGDRRLVLAMRRLGRQRQFGLMIGGSGGGAEASARCGGSGGVTSFGRFCRGFLAPGLRRLIFCPGGVDRDRGAGADPERLVGRRVGQRDAHGKALRDLHPVAARVFRRQHGEARA